MSVGPFLGLRRASNYSNQFSDFVAPIPEMLADGDVHYLSARGPSGFGIYGLLGYTSEYITSKSLKLTCIFHMDRRPKRSSSICSSYVPRPMSLEVVTVLITFLKFHFIDGSNTVILCRYNGGIYSIQRFSAENKHVHQPS